MEHARKGIHSGFETQGRHHKKSENKGMSGPTNQSSKFVFQKENRHELFYFNEENKFWIQIPKDDTNVRKIDDVHIHSDIGV